MQRISLYYSPVSATNTQDHASITLVADSGVSRETSTFSKDGQALAQTVDAMAKEDRAELASFARAVLAAIDQAADRSFADQVRDLAASMRDTAAAILQ